jgi:biopolymer transport protein ExbB
MKIGAWVAALLALVVAAAPVAAHAATWWQKDWPYRKQLTIDTTSKGVQVAGPIGRAPLLIRLHSGNFNFEDAADNGADLRFVAADDKTPITYHIESFDPVLGVATVWIDVKDFPVAATQNLYLYYGNKKATPALDAQGTFDPDYTLVYHFDAAAGAPPRDKTAYGNNAQTAPSGVDDGSVIGKGARLAGTGPVMVPASPSLALAAGAAFTFSAWVKPDAPQARAAIMVRQDAGGGIVVGLDQDVPFVEAGGQKLTAQTPIGMGAWSHVAVVADGHVLTLFVNGKQVATAPATVPALNSPIALGAPGPAAAASVVPFVGGMDEVRFSKVARPAGLIAIDAASQGADSRLITFGADEKPAGVGFGLFGVIVKSVDGTAWFVIGLLGVMLVLSWVVMVGKIRYANAADGANTLFSNLFRELGPDVTVLADEETVGPARLKRLNRSPVYRIYKAGAAEIRKRESQGRALLRAEGIEVVRALMDASLVRENQALSKDIVWLTIAISGGPFLGLLGTVIGVMLTFAAVAAAGDVNINAIAPGISAALLATVAGLAVAIPSMFGYNYILIRNKNITANMNVFVDEFVTRLSEYYSETGYSRAAE